MPHAVMTYLGGGLFTSCELIGNTMLAEAFEAESETRFKCVLPQDIEDRGGGPCGIRDADFKALLGCGAALFRFDGSELDSGTVAEFIFAKSVDIPCVIFRTDFRNAGDQGFKGEPWNLMCSFFPRTAAVTTDSIADYKEARKKFGDNSASLAENLCLSLARRLVEALEEAMSSPPLLKGSDIESAMKWAMKFPGGGLTRLCDEDAGFLREALQGRLHA